MFEEKYQCGELGTFFISSAGFGTSALSLFVAWKFMQVKPNEVPLYYAHQDSSAGEVAGTYYEERQEVSIADSLNKRSSIYSLNMISFGCQAVTFIALLLEVSRVMEDSCQAYAASANLLEGLVLSVMIHMSLLLTPIILYKKLYNFEKEKQFKQTWDQLFGDENDVSGLNVSN